MRKYNFIFVYQFSRLTIFETFYDAIICYENSYQVKGACFSRSAIWFNYLYFFFLLPLLLLKI